MICGCSSQVATVDVAAAILDNSFKTSTPFKNSHSVSFVNSINEWRRSLEAVIKNGDISSSVCFAR